jgi:hypothetical protein
MRDTHFLSGRAGGINIVYHVSQTPLLGQVLCSCLMLGFFFLEPSELISDKLRLFIRRSRDITSTFQAKENMMAAHLFEYHLGQESMNGIFGKMDPHELFSPVF